MTQHEFIQHACEQVMRFTRVHNWHDLSEEIKVQLAFNVGAMALGLRLSKEDGFLALAKLRTGETSMAGYRAHMENVIRAHNVSIDPQKVDRPF